MRSAEKITHCAGQTRQWGEELAAHLKRGDLVALYGDMGAGKTVLAQGICAGLDVEEVVSSPTFTLVHEYHGRSPVFHFDFYRLSSLREAEDLDLDYYWEQKGISLIEWPDRAEAILPDKRINVTIVTVEGFRERRLIRLRIPE
ncbi:MAG TPA: tRNA (adenosine(37)-N6)-threonylcarbamoyltransferase complex ATPase subunit type 1 TsaE [bacterium]|nr:tRNA (adenosine(37)-N6)-threonylcarbamoyltransferase complex ATPase subunit type 1 TsaE [bacterium]